MRMGLSALSGHGRDRGHSEQHLTAGFSSGCMRTLHRGGASYCERPKLGLRNTGDAAGGSPSLPWLGWRLES
jgi:hypothetical protein